MIAPKSFVPECTICIGPMKDPVITECFHSFCQPCITAWLGTKSSCPNCQKVIRNAPGPNFALRDMIENCSRQIVEVARAAIRLVDVVLPLNLAKRSGAAKFIRDKESVKVHIEPYTWQLPLHAVEQSKVSVLFYKTLTRFDLGVPEGSEMGLPDTSDSIALVVRGYFNLKPNCHLFPENRPAVNICFLTTFDADLEETPPLIRACREINHQAVATLVEQGHDVRVRDSNNNTVLHVVKPYNGWLNCAEMCARLIDQGADLQAVNNQGQTALMALRSKMEQFHEEAMVGLIAKGATLGGLDQETLQRLLETALHRANVPAVCNSKVLQRLFIEAKRRMDGRCWDLLALIPPENSLLDLILQHGNQGSDIDFRQEPVGTAKAFFYQAVIDGKLETIKLLLKHHFPFASYHFPNQGNCLDVATI